MEREYPHNFNEAEPYIIKPGHQAANEILTAGKCYFYDTCSFIRHIHLQYPEVLFDYIKKHNGIVVITGCIIMELASGNGILDLKYIEYIRKMHEYGIKVIVMYEEDMFDVLNMCFTTNSSINTYLSLAVKTVKTPVGTIESTLKSDESLMREIFKGSSKDSTLFSRFFKEVRSNKESGDNLGEELIAVCVHMLSNIPDNCSYKYIILTEDKGAVGLINKVSKNIFLYQDKYTISAITTTGLVQRMYDEGIISERHQVEELLSSGMAGDKIRLLGSEEYDLEPKEKTMTIMELADKIVTPNKIHINY